MNALNISVTIHTDAQQLRLNGECRLLLPMGQYQQYISIQLAALRKPSGAGGTPVRYWSLIEGDSGVCERDLRGKVSVDT